MNVNDNTNGVANKSSARLWIYPLTLIAFYIYWLFADKGMDLLSLYEVSWGPAMTMMFGSVVAGSTPFGGGAVAFPVLTKVLGVEPYQAKLFSLFIQAVGMSFATLFFISRKVKIYWRELAICMPASLIVIPCALSQTQAVDYWLKFAFTEFVLSTMLILWLCNQLDNNSTAILDKRKVVILFIGAALGSFLSANLGSGSDVVMFFVLVFVLGRPIKESIPTTIVLMAFNAAYASILLVFVKPIDIPEFVIHSWWAACVVVAIGAPLGGLLLMKLKDQWVQALIYMLVCLEIVTTMLNPDIPIELRITVAVSSVSVLMFIIFSSLKRNTNFIASQTDI